MIMNITPGNLVWVKYKIWWWPVPVMKCTAKNLQVNFLTESNILTVPFTDESVKLYDCEDKEKYIQEGKAIPNLMLRDLFNKDVQRVEALAMDQKYKDPNTKRHSRRKVACSYEEVPELPDDCEDFCNTKLNIGEYNPKKVKYKIARTEKQLDEYLSMGKKHKTEDEDCSNKTSADNNKGGTSSTAIVTGTKKSGKQKTIKNHSHSLPSTTSPEEMISSLVNNSASLYDENVKKKKLNQCKSNLYSPHKNSVKTNMSDTKKKSKCSKEERQVSPKKIGKGNSKKCKSIQVQSSKSNIGGNVDKECENGQGEQSSNILFSESSPEFKVLKKKNPLKYKKRKGNKPKSLNDAILGNSSCSSEVSELDERIFSSQTVDELTQPISDLERDDIFSDHGTSLSLNISDDGNIKSSQTVDELCKNNEIETENNFIITKSKKKKKVRRKLDLSSSDEKCDSLTKEINIMQHDDKKSLNDSFHYSTVSVVPAVKGNKHKQKMKKQKCSLRQEFKLVNKKDICRLSCVNFETSNHTQVSGAEDTLDSSFSTDITNSPVISKKNIAVVSRKLQKKARRNLHNKANCLRAGSSNVENSDMDKTSEAISKRIESLDTSVESIESSDCNSPSKIKTSNINLFATSSDDGYLDKTEKSEVKSDTVCDTVSGCSEKSLASLNHASNESSFHSENYKCPLCNNYETTRRDSVVIHMRYHSRSSVHPALSPKKSEKVSNHEKCNFIVNHNSPLPGRDNTTSQHLDKSTLDKIPRKPENCKRKMKHKGEEATAAKVKKVEISDICTLSAVSSLESNLDGSEFINGSLCEKSHNCKTANEYATKHVAIHEQADSQTGDIAMTGSKICNNIRIPQNVERARKRHRKSKECDISPVLPELISNPTCGIHFKVSSYSDPHQKKRVQSKKVNKRKPKHVERFQDLCSDNNVLSSDAETIESNKCGLVNFSPSISQNQNLSNTLVNATDLQSFECLIQTPTDSLKSVGNQSENCLNRDSIDSSSDLNVSFELKSSFDWLKCQGKDKTTKSKTYSRLNKKQKNAEIIKSQKSDESLALTYTSSNGSTVSNNINHLDIEASTIDKSEIGYVTKASTMKSSPTSLNTIANPTCQKRLTKLCLNKNVCKRSVSNKGSHKDPESSRLQSSFPKLSEESYSQTLDKSTWNNIDSSSTRKKCVLEPENRDNTELFSHGNFSRKMKSNTIFRHTKRKNKLTPGNSKLGCRSSQDSSDTFVPDTSLNTADLDKHQSFDLPTITLKNKQQSSFEKLTADSYSQTLAKSTLNNINSANRRKKCVLEQENRDNSELFSQKIFSTKVKPKAIFRNTKKKNNLMLGDSQVGCSTSQDSNTFVPDTSLSTANLDKHQSFDLPTITMKKRQQSSLKKLTKESCSQPRDKSMWNNSANANKRCIHELQNKDNTDLFSQENCSPEVKPKTIFKSTKRKNKLSPGISKLCYSSSQDSSTFVPNTSSNIANLDRRQSLELPSITMKKRRVVNKVRSKKNLDSPTRSKRTPFRKPSGKSTVLRKSKVSKRRRSRRLRLDPSIFDDLGEDNVPCYYPFLLKSDHLNQDNASHSSLSSQLENNEQQSSSDEDELPAAFSRSPSLKGAANFLMKGSLVWTKIRRYPYWPSLIKNLYKKRRKIIKVSLIFLGFGNTNQRRGILIQYKDGKILPFGLNGDNIYYNKLKEEGLKHENSDSFKLAFQRAEDYIMQKARGGVSNSFDYFKEEFSYGRFSELSEDENHISEGSEIWDNSQETRETVTTDDTLTITSISENSDMPVTSAESSPLGQDPVAQKRMERSERLIDFIKRPETEEYLLKIYNGTVHSDLHLLYHKKNKTKMEQSLLKGSKFGPISDDIQENEVTDILMEFSKKTDLDDFKRTSYVFDVWLREAIVYAIWKVRKTSKAKAWVVFDKGATLSEREKKTMTENLMNMKHTIAPEDRERYQQSRERRTKLWASQLMMNM